LYSPSAPFSPSLSSLVCFTTTSPAELYTLSLHDALPIYRVRTAEAIQEQLDKGREPDVLAELRKLGVTHLIVRRRLQLHDEVGQDRKSTRLNSSHGSISYAVFCLKKKKTIKSRNHNAHEK